MTLYSISGRQPHGLGDEARWQIMASRAERLLRDLETAVCPDGSPGLERLADETLALRTALCEAARARVLVSVIWRDGFEYGRGAAENGELAKPARPALCLARPEAESDE